MVREYPILYNGRLHTDLEILGDFEQGGMGNDSCGDDTIEGKIKDVSGCSRYRYG
jgi:hypothetical protein